MRLELEKVVLAINYISLIFFAFSCGSGEISYKAQDQSEEIRKRIPCSEYGISDTHTEPFVSSDGNWLCVPPGARVLCNDNSCHTECRLGNCANYAGYDPMNKMSQYFYLFGNYTGSMKHCVFNGYVFDKDGKFYYQCKTDEYDSPSNWMRNTGMTITTCCAS